MPKNNSSLSDKEVQHLKGDQVVAVGGVPGLTLKIRKGHKCWYLRYRFNKSEKIIALGPYPLVSLKEARDKGNEYRKLIINKIDPQTYRDELTLKVKQEQDKQRLDALTFRKAFYEYLRDKDEHDPIPDKDRQDFIARMKKYVFPVIGKMPINSINNGHIAEVLRPLWSNQVSLARKVRARTREVFAWHKGKGNLFGDIPVDNQVLRTLLPKLKAPEEKHHPMLAIQEIPRFMKALRQEPGAVARHLEFAILTASRMGNVRKAEWNQINWETRQWVIPAKEMKVPRNGDHIVPLSPRAIEILREMQEMPKHRLIFNNKGSKFSDMAGAAVIKRLSRRAESKGEKPFVDPNEVDVNGSPKIACPHGIARASFRTWALNDDLGNDKRFTQRTAELCLHHNVSDAYNGAYERNEALKSRAEMLNAWADYCEQEG